MVNMPSNPPAWSAGKWMEWYPDILGPDRQLTTAIKKPYWQSGWLAQHDRLMRAISNRRRGASRWSVAICTPPRPGRSSAREA